MKVKEIEVFCDAENRTYLRRRWVLPRTLSCPETVVRRPGASNKKTIPTQDPYTVSGGSRILSQLWISSRAGWTKPGPWKCIMLWKLYARMELAIRLARLHRQPYIRKTQTMLTDRQGLPILTYIDMDPKRAGKSSPHRAMITLKDIGDTSIATTHTETTSQIVDLGTPWQSSTTMLPPTCGLPIFTLATTNEKTLSTRNIMKSQQ